MVLDQHRQAVDNAESGKGPGRHNPQSGVRIAQHRAQVLGPLLVDEQGGEVDRGPPPRRILVGEVRCQLRQSRGIGERRRVQPVDGSVELGGVELANGGDRLGGRDFRLAAPNLVTRARRGD
jgi:hypothetical protein